MKFYNLCFLIVFYLFSTMMMAQSSVFSEDFALNPCCLGLPYYVERCGYGMPNEIEKDIVLDMIYEIFEKYDIPLDTNHVHQQGDMAFPLHGYNERHHLGFMWMNLNQLDRDAIGWWWYMDFNSDDLLYFDEETDKEIIVDALQHSYMASQSLRQMATETMAIKDDLERKKQIKETYNAYILEGISFKSGGFEEHKEYICSIDNETLKEQEIKKLAIKQIIYEYQHDGCSDSLTTFIEKALLLNDLDSLQAAKFRVQKSYKREKLSISEVEYINQQMKAKKLYIILIQADHERYHIPNKYLNKKERKKCSKINDRYKEERIREKAIERHRKRIKANLEEDILHYLKTLNLIE